MFILFFLLSKTSLFVLLFMIKNDRCRKESYRSAAGKGSGKRPKTQTGAPRAAQKWDAQRTSNRKKGGRVGRSPHWSLGPGTRMWTGTQWNLLQPRASSKKPNKTRKILARIMSEMPVNHKEL